MWTQYITALLILHKKKGLPVFRTTTTTCLKGGILLGLGYMGMEWGFGFSFPYGLVCCAKVEMLTCVHVLGLTVQSSFCNGYWFVCLFQLHHINFNIVQSYKKWYSTLKRYLQDIYVVYGYWGGEGWVSFSVSVWMICLVFRLVPTQRTNYSIVLVITGIV